MRGRPIVAGITTALTLLAAPLVSALVLGGHDTSGLDVNDACTTNRHDASPLGQLGISEAWAQQEPPQVVLKVENEDVEAGEVVSVSLIALWPSGAPQATDPKLTLPKGVTGSGPFIASRSQTSWVNGQVTSRAGFSATWKIPTTREGTIDIGPGQVTWSGRTIKTQALRIAVHAVGSRPKGFDPFGGLFRAFPSMDDAPPERPAPNDPKFSMSEPLEPTAFLRPMLSKTSAVVGELVVLSVYLYTQPISRFQVADPHEPSTPDFIQRSISNVRDAGARRVSINGVSWTVQLVLRSALFPLKTGHLATGPMTVTLVGRGFNGSGLSGGLVRSSPSVSVNVVEPPTAGRPQGYVVGDVGGYKLSAVVEPRTVPAGGSVAVTAVLQGDGNLPTTLRVPEQKGVTWLDPEVREAIDAHDEEVSGTRTFTYIVKLDRPGKNELGELSLPYWSASRKAYDVARVKLGSVDVTGVAPAPVASAPPDPFTAIGPERKVANAFTPAKPPPGEHRWFWGALLGGPLLVVSASTLMRAIQALRARRAKAGTTSDALTREALSDAAKHAASGDGSKASAAIERALVASVEARTGIKLRGLLRDEIAASLSKAGVDAKDAREVQALLMTCDTWRFDPDRKPEGDPVRTATQIVERLRGGAK